MISLRPDQLRAVSDLREKLRDNQSVLLQAACGFGKTVVAAFMASGAYQKRRRVIFAVHRRELARQTALTFDKFDIPYGYIMAGMPSNPFASVQIASADTLRNRPQLAKCDLFVPDEAHLWGAKTRAELIDLARADGAHIVPLTATPARGDGRPMRRIADAMVCGPSVLELIKAGNLAGYRPYAPVRPDLSKLHTRAGDYVPAELDELMGRPAVARAALRFYRQFAMGRRMIGYATSRKRGAELAAEFVAGGVQAAFIDGETPDAERRNVIGAFADGRIAVLFNCQLFREGFDLSAQVGRHVPIQAVGLYNPTQSLPLAIQMMMRGMRPQDGVSVILDHAGVMIGADGRINHGFPDDEREWSLDGNTVNKRAGEAAIPTVTCDECFAIFRPQPACPYCGAVRQTGGREVEEIDAELVEVDIERARLQADFDRRQKHEAHVRAKIEERACKTRQDWIDLAKKRGFKIGWALKMWEIKGRKSA